MHEALRSQETRPHRHEGKDFAAVTAPDVRDHEHGSCWIAAIVHRSTDIQKGRRCARRSEGTGGWWWRASTLPRSWSHT